MPANDGILEKYGKKRVERGGKMASGAFKDVSSRCIEQINAKIHFVKESGAFRVSVIKSCPFESSVCSVEASLERAKIECSKALVGIEDASHP